MQISTNMASINASRAQTNNVRDLTKSLNELASGTRINKAADDAAGLALSKNMDMNLRSVTQANRNAQDAVSVIQIAEGSYNEMNSIVIRLRELGIAASSDTVSDIDRKQINSEMKHLRSEIERIGESTRFGTQKLLGNLRNEIEFQVGINGEKDASRISLKTSELQTDLEKLGLDAVDFESKESARQSLGHIDYAQTELGSQRASLGALQNRVTSGIDQLWTQGENTAAAKSRLADTDIAEATTEAVSKTIFTKANVAVLAQANQSQAVALKLI